MGAKLMPYYALIEKEGGLAAKVKLATATKIPSIRAATEPDSDANLALFRKAFQEVAGKPAPHL